jgi:nitrous oxidase accessory protein NosD
MTGVETVQARSTDIIIPRAEVFYSQYRYVVGYYGIGSLVDELNREGNERQFGRPLTIYVTDFAGIDPVVGADGLLKFPAHRDRTLPWVKAEEAVFVIDSEARTTGGPAVVPFSSAEAARTFVEAHGGRMVEWAELRTMRFGTLQASRSGMADARANLTAWADETVADQQSLLDRPVSVTVGSDTADLQTVIDDAPPNTTVRLAPGTHDGNLTIDKPLTIRGSGAETHLNGDGTGSVIRVTAPRVAVADLSITGVGNNTSVSALPGYETDWDYRVKLGYGYGDAGVEFDSATDSLVHDVEIETPANGVLFRYSHGSVVDDVSVDGTEVWADGFMGVMVFESRVVIQESTFRGGRDGVYTHRSDGLVIRDNRMAGLRFGVHEMYTSNALVANNSVTDSNVGVIVMTRPVGNMLIDNEVTASRAGLSVAGAASYVAGNTVETNDYGLLVASRRSIYEHNRIVDNAVGIRSSTLIPTNRITANDLLNNDRHVLAVLGPLRIWPGNYWAGAPGIDRDGDGRLERAYRPSGVVDGRIHRVDATPTLVRSPAVDAIRSLQELVPGLRSTGVLDPAPRARPAGERGDA